MLETTFLGHQGWQFATAGARILVDPLLVEPFGHNGGVGVVYPPRILDIAAMGPVDAVFLSHEHEDHFNIPSVNRISRDIPFYVPERSSTALRLFLQEAGFTVNLLSPGRTVTIGDLSFTCFSGDHVRHDEQDEWDTLAFLVQDTKDGGSFFSPVDISTTATMEAELRQRGVAPGLWGYANNTMNLSAQEQPSRPPPVMFPIVTRFVAEHTRRPSPPHASLMCGGGFAFTGSRAWLNHVFFPLDSDALFEGLQKLSPQERFIVPIPGVQVTTDRNRVTGVTESAPFLRTAPRAQWPDRTYKPLEVKPAPPEPASGRTELRAGELDELKERLAAFADFLYGSPLFRGLYSLTPTQLPQNVKAAFAICAMSGETDHVFEYEPAAGRFALLPKARPPAEYVAALECFATDLLEFLRGELAPSALMFGRANRWRGSNENLIGSIDHAIWLYGHPLKNPGRYLKLYRSIYAREPRDTPKVRSRKPAKS
jgi:hypothetical protein